MKVGVRVPAIDVALSPRSWCQLTSLERQTLAVECCVEQQASIEERRMRHYRGLRYVRFVQSLTTNRGRDACEHARRRSTNAILAGVRRNTCMRSGVLRRSSAG